MIDGLLIAFIIKISLTDMVVGFDQSEIRFAMRKHKDLQ